MFDIDPFLRSLSYFKSRVRLSLVTDAANENDWRRLNEVFKAWFKSYTGTSFRIHDFELKLAAASIADLMSDLELRSFSDVRQFTGAWVDLLELVNNLWAECEIDPDDVDSVTDELDDWIWPDELSPNTRPYWAYQYGVALSRMATSIRNSSGRLDSQAVLEDLTQDYAWAFGVDMAEWLALDLQGVEWGRSDWAFSQFNLRPSPEEPGYGILDARPIEDEYWAMRCGLEKGQDRTSSGSTVVDMTRMAEDTVAARSIGEASSLGSVRLSFQ